MIQNVDVKGVHMEVGPDLQKYAIRKISKLDRFIPKNARESVRAEVFLKESKAKDKKSCTCEVIIHLPGEQVTTKESTMNIFAAVDIVEAKLKNQLTKYKDTHNTIKLHRRVLSRIRKNV